MTELNRNQRFGDGQLDGERERSHWERLGAALRLHRGPPGLSRAPAGLIAGEVHRLGVIWELS